jgi:4-aminobutyrate aminotransferase-like enzyme
VQSGVGRTGPVWAIEHYGVEPDLLVSGKSLGGGLPLAGVTGRSELMDAVHPGGLGGTFGGNPVACAAASVVLDAVSAPEFRARSERLGETLRTRLDAIARDVEGITDVRGLGPMLAIELEDGARASATLAAARSRGLLLLTCGLYGNVIRLLPPLTLSDEDATAGMDILEAALRETAQ